MCGDSCGNSAMQMYCGECLACVTSAFPWKEMQRTLGSLLALTLATQDRRMILVGENADRGLTQRTRFLNSAVRGGIGAETHRFT